MRTPSFHTNSAPVLHTAIGRILLANSMTDHQPELDGPLAEIRRLGIAGQHTFQWLEYRRRVARSSQCDDVVGDAARSARSASTSYDSGKTSHRLRVFATQSRFTGCSRRSASRGGPLMVRAGRPIRVLIAEDDNRVRAALRAFLTSHPRIVVVADARRAVDALAHARELVPDVALVDVYLPALADGLGLLRALSGESGLTVVAMSIDASAREHALGAGATRFLEKARVPDELLDLLEGCGPRQMT
jgi:CheY-like chemotaxis protein